jgi:hypothetical protein
MVFFEGSSMVMAPWEKAEEGGGERRGGGLKMI